MQPPPLPNSTTIRYQSTRAELLRIWSWQMMRRLLPSSLLAIVMFGVVCVESPSKRGTLIPILIACVLIPPFTIRNAVGRGIDVDKKLTDPMTLTFSEAGLNLSGPDWAIHETWSTFCGFAEDARYFYLKRKAPALDAILPKHQLSTEDAAEFRRCALSRLGKTPGGAPAYAAA